MLSLIKRVPIRELLSIEAPSLAISLTIAELLYKFHSFTLECLAFLATWSLVAGLVRWVTGRDLLPGSLHHDAG